MKRDALGRLTKRGHLEPAHLANKVAGGGDCTLSDARRFYSYRRDRDTGRMASLIWIKPGR